MDRKSLAAAFPVTVPVLMGYLAIGIAFGFMLQAIGYNFIWAFFMSLDIYAGSGQYLGVSLLSSAAALSTVAVMTLLINFRHLVYGLSMLEKFRGMGLRQVLHDLFPHGRDLCAAQLGAASGGRGPPELLLSIALLDQSYWILGSVIGAVAGALLPIDTTGIDFAMTALFVVIAVDQWRAYKRHLPALLGAGATLLSLFLVGAEKMLLPALGVIVLALLLLRRRLDERGTAAERRRPYADSHTGRGRHRRDGGGHLPDPGPALPPL